jgi:toxin-antitoxin system PIN domain toxin
MVLPDINLLVFAYNADAPQHEPAKSWLEDLLSGDDQVGLTWAVILGHIRIMTNPAVLEHPLRPHEALADVRLWMERPQVQIIRPGPRHLNILEHLLNSIGVGANLTTDAHLAAMAIEHQCELHSSDRDFDRFPGLRWKNPLLAA